MIRWTVTGPGSPQLLAEPLLSPAVQNRLRCPICRGALQRGQEGLRCVSPDCSTTFPIIRGVPVLLNERRSLFHIQDVIHSTSEIESAQPGPAQALFRQLVPSISLNTRARRNLALVRRLLLQQTLTPQVLVVGAGTIGQGLEELIVPPGIELVETDVVLRPRVCLVCDGHDLPFEDGSFDGVVAQALLEHVVDPQRCVAEIHRVLKPDGLVYAETPFMQQVHLGRYDFTRFTHLGHRRLFRRFEEIESGVTCGPGMALAWSYLYFLLSFSDSKAMRRLIKAFASLTSFFLKYVDYWLIDKPGAYDAASGCYLIGKKSDRELADRDLIGLYRGVS